MQIFFDGFTATEESDSPPPAINISGVVTNVSSHGAANGAIDVTVSGGTPPFSYLWNGGATTEDRAGLVPGTYTITVTDIAGASASKSFQVTEPSVMEASYSKTDATTDGGSDGTITLIITGGSGNRTYQWSDGPTTQNRTGLAAGDYTVLIHDVSTLEEIFLTITITDPEPAFKPGTFLEVPAMNSLTFVIEQDINSCHNPQALDNVLLCDQYYEGFDQTNYFQRLNQCDAFPIQFNSDYKFFEVYLRKYSTGEVVETYPFELKENNLGATENFGINIRNHTGIGQSRVYFNAGTIPIPLSTGQTFEIMDNLHGYNGNYAIVDILNDPTLGYQYLVINKNFTGGPIETGTGKFKSATANFNVFETPLNFVGVSAGHYYVTIRAYNDGNQGLSITAVSEPIDLQLVHLDTVLFKARNTDNAFGMTWTTGIQVLMRIPAHFGHRRTPGGERSISRNSDYSVVKINAKKTRGMLFQVWSLPPYMHEKIGVLVDCDSFSLNNIPCSTTEAYAEPEYKDRFLLANSSVKVETKWFDNYNSDDITTVSEGGFIMTETGFLKR